MCDAIAPCQNLSFKQWKKTFVKNAKKIAAKAVNCGKKYHAQCLKQCKTEDNHACMLNCISKLCPGINTLSQCAACGQGHIDPSQSDAVGEAMIYNYCTSCGKQHPVPIPLSPSTPPKPVPIKKKKASKVARWIMGILGVGLLIILIIAIFRHRRRVPMRNIGGF